MNDNYRKIIEIESLPNAGTTSIPTNLTFDNLNCIMKSISALIIEPDSKVLKLPINTKDRAINFTINNTGEINIITSKDESLTKAIFTIEYKKIKS